MYQYPILVSILSIESGLVIIYRESTIGKQLE